MTDDAPLAGLLTRLARLEERAARAEEYFLWDSLVFRRSLTPTDLSVDDEAHMELPTAALRLRPAQWIVSVLLSRPRRMHLVPGRRAPWQSCAREQIARPASISPY